MPGPGKCTLLYTQIPTHTAVSMHQHRGTSSVFPGAQSSGLGTLDSVIISSEVSFDILFMSILELSHL